MKKLIFLFFFGLSCSAISAQEARSFASIDKSPLDMAYYPSEYPVLKAQRKANDPCLARILYSRPNKSGRKIFGDLIEYGEVWRLGANEATEIEFYNDVRVAGKKVKKGRYTMYAIPNPEEWVIILNSDTDTWGAFRYDDKKDVLRTTVPVVSIESTVEALSMTFQKNGTDKNCSLVIAWDDVSVALPLAFQ